MAEPSKPTCPICRRPVGARADVPTFPFCSARCRQVDLGAWLTERYRVDAAVSDEAATTPAASETPKTNDENNRIH